MSENLFWGLGLMLLALFLVVIEVFIPSGGIIGILSAGVAIAGIVMLFQESPTWGMSGVLAVIVLVPVLAWLWIKVFPHTPMGRRLILANPSADDEDGQPGTVAVAEAAAAALLGAEGLAETDLRPVGVVNIDGQRLDALSESTFVAAGTRVRVTRVEGNTVKVRPLA